MKSPYIAVKIMAKTCRSLLLSIVFTLVLVAYFEGNSPSSAAAAISARQGSTQDSFTRHNNNWAVLVRNVILRPIRMEIRVTGRELDRGR